MKINRIYNRIKKNRRVGNGRDRSVLLAPAGAALLFAMLALFSPLSGILVSAATELTAVLHGGGIGNADFGAGINAALLSAAFPGHGEAGVNTAVDVIAPVQDDAAEVSDPHGGSFEDLPVRDDSPVFSVYDYYTKKSGVRIAEPEADNTPIPEDAYPVTAMNTSGQKNEEPELLISNQTSLNIDLYNYLARPYPIKNTDIASGGPLVLIVCTHATESYMDAPVNFYSDKYSANRTDDTEKNVVRVARELKSVLESAGIPTVQSEKLHDAAAFNSSYKRSLETVTEYVKRYPSLRYVIDVHRDSMIREDGEKLRPSIKINETPTAQMMMVIGTDDGGLAHDGWQDNLTAATWLQERLNEKYPMLMRPINLRSQRFNQHMTPGSMILEVGSCGNTLEEAINAVRLFGEVFAEVILE